MKLSSNEKFQIAKSAQLINPNPKNVLDIMKSISIVYNKLTNKKVNFYKVNKGKFLGGQTTKLENTNITANYIIATRPRLNGAIPSSIFKVYCDYYTDIANNAIKNSIKLAISMKNWNINPDTIIIPASEHKTASIIGKVLSEKYKATVIRTVKPLNTLKGARNILLLALKSQGITDLIDDTPQSIFKKASETPGLKAAASIFYDAWKKHKPLSAHLIGSRWRKKVFAGLQNLNDNDIDIINNSKQIVITDDSQSGSKATIKSILYSIKSKTKYDISKVKALTLIQE